jgi:hypothetical protein
LKDELEAEHLGEEDQPLEGEGRRVSFEGRQAALADAERVSERLLRNTTCFAPSTEDLADLAGIGDELAHAFHLPGE